MEEQQRGVKLDSVLTFTSLLTILLLTFHLADDIVRGFEPGGRANLIAVPICVVWLYGTIVLAGRRSGYIIMLVGSLFGMLVPWVHMGGRGVGMGSRIAGTHGGFFFVWMLIAMGVTGMFMTVLTVHGLWRLPWRRRT
jgi:hypothetical protein